MIFGIPFKVILVLTGNLLTGHFSKSKSKENWIWRAPVPAIGRLNPGTGVRLEPEIGLIWETFALLKSPKDSAGRRFSSLTIGPARRTLRLEFIASHPWMDRLEPVTRG